MKLNSLTDIKYHVPLSFMCTQTYLLVTSIYKLGQVLTSTHKNTLTHVYAPT